LLPASYQPAIRHNGLAQRTEGRVDGQRARLVAVELEWREEIHTFDGSDMPARKHRERGLGKCLYAHNAKVDGVAIIR